MTTAEHRRLEDDRLRVAYWKRWGPYVSDRAWGTVREDYSPHGTAWDYLPHDHARSRAYRWNEDGIAGLCDRHQELCLALALWNERDPILKERFFGLTGTEGNHGEDLKEHYFYLDSTPTHSYMRMLYKYPQAAFPYDWLVSENANRSRLAPEFELHDTGIFDGDRYFDVVVEYAKSDPEDIVMRVTATNRGPEDAPLHVLPTIWFRNTWSWTTAAERPQLGPATAIGSASVLQVRSPRYGSRVATFEAQPGAPPPSVLVTDNDTNVVRLFGAEAPGRYFKDGINDAVVGGRHDAVNPAGVGTKAAAHYILTVPAGRSVVVRMRFSPAHRPATTEEVDAVILARRAEADEFYSTVIPSALGPDARGVMRQSLAGLLWSKQYYHYVVKRWLEGDPALPPPPAERVYGRNHQWTHLFNADVLSMPDKWEYPWYAAWDLAFHTVPIALVDPEFAKGQLTLMLREWYQHPNGQLPAFEWGFGDVHPPVHAWAAWRVYKIEKKRRGVGDREFLERVFQKLLLNFTWWVNRKDSDGSNVFEGGFLGLDNIGVFDRSAALPTGGRLKQSDATSWMAMYSLNLLAIALELARENPTYEDMASKFWEHFLYIASAMGHKSGQGLDLWDDDDGFFYDCLCFDDGSRLPLKVRSMVGLIPLFAVETLEPEMLDRLPGFKRRLEWFIDHRKDLVENVACMRTPGRGERRLLSVVTSERLCRVLQYLLDEDEFLSPYGVRALSRCHKDRPYVLAVDGREYRVSYEPAESSSDLFGGNSNWRGPVWFPVNYLLIEALQKFHHYFGDSVTVEYPKGSGRQLTLDRIAAELSRRLSSLFLRDESGRRPVLGDVERFQHDPHWRDLVPFHEYFDGDTGRGVGASHQTGWTGLVAKLLQQSGDDDPV